MQSARGKVELATRSQLEELWDETEDWSGKADAKERRRLQNRLHQRAWRRRNAAAKNSTRQMQCQPDGGDPERNLQASDSDLLSTAFAEATSVFVKKEPPDPSHTSKEVNEGIIASRHTRRPDQVEPGRRHATTYTQTEYINRDATISANKQLPPIILFLYARTKPSFSFPLAPDYHLITLIQYNVMRGIMSNLSICSLIGELPRTCEAASLIPPLEPPSSLPPTFEPTEYQMSTPHPPWMNSIPCPRFRENVILADLQGLYDEHQLCEDICGGLFAGYDDTKQKGLLVWGEPWQVGSWEISDGFAQKWGWLLKGCTEMVDATNRWREFRGEEGLVIEIE